MSEVENLVNNVTSPIEEDGKVSGKMLQMDNRATVSMKVSYGYRMVPEGFKKRSYKTK